MDLSYGDLEKRLGGLRDLREYEEAMGVTSTDYLVILLRNSHKGSSQNSDPILVPLNIRCRNIIIDRKGPIIVATTYMLMCEMHVPGLIGLWLVSSGH